MTRMLDGLIADREWMRREIAALRSCMSWQHGRHIETLPTEPALAPNHHPVIVAGPSPAQRRIHDLEKRLAPLHGLQ